MKSVITAVFLLFLLACSISHNNTNLTVNATSMTSTTLSTRDAAVCPQVQHADSGLNFIFVFHNLQQNDSDHYYNQSIEYLRSIEPFSSIPFNTYKIDLDRTLCWPKGDKTVVRSLLTCDWDVVNEKLVACGVPNEKVIFITGDLVQTSTVSTYYKNSFTVISEPDFGRYTLLHETGHLFGLQEEYLTLKTKPGTISRQPRKPNCAANMSQAKEWWGSDVGLEGTGYYEGCAGHLNYYRPNKETLMGDRAPADAGYGYVSTQYLQQAYNCCYASNRTAYSCDAFFSKYPDWQACRS